MDNARVMRMSVISVLVFVILLSSCGPGQRSAEQASPAAAASGADVDTPFTTFSQDIQSSEKSLELHPEQTTSVPIVLHNTGTSLWSSSGRYPITISYKWFEHGVMLPIEGERTTLPGPVKPGASVNMQVKIVAPREGRNLVLKITLVQEGVQWFMLAGAKPLELPVTLRRSA